MPWPPSFLNQLILANSDNSDFYIASQIGENQLICRTKMAVRIYSIFYRHSDEPRKKFVFPLPKTKTDKVLSSVTL